MLTDWPHICKGNIYLLYLQHWLEEIFLTKTSEVRSLLLREDRRLTWKNLVFKLPWLAQSNIHWGHDNACAEYSTAKSWSRRRLRSFSGWSVPARSQSSWSIYPSKNADRCVHCFITWRAMDTSAAHLKRQSCTSSPTSAAFSWSLNPGTPGFFVYSAVLI